MSEADPIGRLALERGLLTPAQLDQAARRQASQSPPPPLGAVLAGLGFLTHDQVDELLAVPGAAPPAAAVRPTRDTWQLETEPSGGAPPEPLPTYDTCAGTELRAAPTPTDSSAPTLTGEPPAPDRKLAYPFQGGPAGPAASPASLRRAFGKYELLEELGRGGMGVVYKAYRRDLKACFAVKVLLAGEDASPEGVARFQREAQAAARLRHPGIVSVHDLGVEEGKPYYAMDLVEGTSLDRVLDEPARAGFRPPESGTPGVRRRGLAVRDAARVVHDVAEAIEHAHSQSVVHRDLKPANILLDAAGAALVLDFGLAKILDREGEPRGARITRTGVVMGTLAYMPPEQAAGDVRRIDARSDVYSLGALLYEIVTGRPPFSGTTEVELLGQVLTVEPVRPSRVNPALPPDVETIILKAMEKDPARRYARAAELAADLRRYLDGEAIRARPPSLVYRVSTWTRRRRGQVAAGVVVLAAATLAGTAFWRARAAEAQQAALRAQVLRELRERVGVYVHATLSLRRAGLPIATARTEYLPRVEAAAREAERQDPAQPEPNYYLGRMYRALMQFEPARREQDRALAKAPGYAPSRYERALLVARDFRTRVTALRDAWLREEGERLAASGLLAQGGLGGEKVRERPGDVDLVAGDPTAQELRRALLADLERLEADAAVPRTVPPPAPASTPAGSVPVALELSPAMLTAARGLRLLCTSPRPEDAAQARTLFEQAARDDPRLEEAHEGLIQLAWATGQLEVIVAAYSRGLELDRGYLPFWGGRADARNAGALTLAERGEDPSALYQKAIADYGAALTLDPASAPLWIRRATSRMNWGNYLRGRGQDCTPRYREAEADLERAVELDATCAIAWQKLGLLRADWGWALEQRSEDARALFGRAESDFARALQLDPTGTDTLRHRGWFFMTLGCCRERRGEDPRPDFSRSLADYDRALVLDPTSANAWKARGSTRAKLGSFRRLRGEDPVGDLTGAIADFGKAIDLNPRFVGAYVERCGVRFSMAALRAATGAEAEALFAAAEADGTKALELNPASSEALVNRGSLRSHWAGLRVRRGEDPDRLYAQAEEDFTRALTYNPRLTEAYVFRGDLRANWGRAKMARDLDPEPLFAAVESDYGQALALRPGWSRAWIGQGVVRLLRGDWARHRGTDARPHYERAAAGLDQALAAAPGNVEGTWRRGVARVRLGRFAEGLADFATAEQRQPGCEGGFRSERIEAHLGLARAAVTAATGAGAPTADEAARLRDEAFTHLEAAVRAGCQDAEALRTDPELAALRADPRWDGLLNSINK